MSCHSAEPPSHCPSSSPDLKLYQAFIFSVPVFFTFILLFLFYAFYLRRRASWQSLRMRASNLNGDDNPTPSEAGIKKELREMLPVVVFKESFAIRETQCSVCLGDYQADDRLQRLPQCGHSFHVDCISHWFSSNTTCPLCRVSLLSPSKAPPCTLSHGDSENQEDEQSYRRQPLEMQVDQRFEGETTHGFDDRTVVIDVV
ncbi:RING-H2 finger protein ATL7 [Apostasia shenzhenica]|uniref:RING-type E3 ubiquitin transferase n=1 Tax=Apostasia shenzhenica TaxID=1088818 RepID=A0A2I0ANM4_9ASPA|nr:RING-H2 finger protein ATL7 [Apostasia shenzhenica]